MQVAKGKLTIKQRSCNVEFGGADYAPTPDPPSIIRGRDLHDNFSIHITGTIKYL